MLSFLKLTSDMVAAFAQLRVPQDEAHLISGNAAWMAQAALTPYAVTFGVFEGNTPAAAPVALISLIDPRVVDENEDPLAPDCLYLWRVMVDHTHRRRGIGRHCITFAERYARLVGLSGVSLTTMDTQAGNAGLL